MTHINTRCIQSGWKPKNGEPRVLPIYQSTTFKYESSDQMAKLFDLEEPGYFYTRLQNPTNDCVAEKIAELEGGRKAILLLLGKPLHSILCLIFVKRAITLSAPLLYTAVLLIYFMSQ